MHLFQALQHFGSWIHMLEPQRIPAPSKERRVELGAAIVV